MAAFVCFSNTKEKNTLAYKDLINRLRLAGRVEHGGQTHEATSASFLYYTKHKGQSTHEYKDFCYQLRKTEFNVICMILCDNPSAQLRSFVRNLEAVQLGDGPNANAYYGEIKKNVTGFMNYFTHIIDDVVRKIDKYTAFLNVDVLVKLIDKTIKLSEENQIMFIEDFLPIKSPEEQKKYDEIVENNTTYIDKLRKYKDFLAVVLKQDRLGSYAKEQFEASIKKVNELCTFTHGYLAGMLADRLYEISVSVEETVFRMNTNMRQYNEKCAAQLNTLINTLYDKNKEMLFIQRRERKRSEDSAEVNRTIEVLKNKIEHYGNEETIARLELETRYWAKRLKDFNEIALILTKLNNELESVIAEEEKYNQMRVTDLPGPKTICFEHMGKNFAKRKKYLSKKISDTSRTLMTFFCVRGTDRILYTDNVGSYYCDEFNHQNYISDYGRKFFHVNCVGNFLENYETDPYYFDEYGRYTLVNGEKIHQCAPCTSQYKLGLDGLLKKITKDCGHSEKVNLACRLEIKDLTDVEILPKTDIIDITKTLDRESVKYLWDCYGLILPEVLYDLAEARPKNPIHYLAHLLLNRRYDYTNSDLKYLKKLADKYRTDIHKARKEKAAAASREWRSKFVKPRKPEESDDALEWAAYIKQITDWQFINSLDYYNESL